MPAQQHQARDAFDPPLRSSAINAPALEQLRERLSSKPALKDVVPCDDTLRWYLRDRYFDVPEAEQKLISMLSWKKDFQPGKVTAASVAKEVSTGKAYVHEHPDNYGRPAIVIRVKLHKHHEHPDNYGRPDIAIVFRVKLHKVGQYPIDDSKRLCVHLIDSALGKLPEEGEQIVGIFDMRDFQVTENADFAFARFMIDAFFEYYPRRVGQVLFVEAPWVFIPAWEAIKPLMRKYSALVRFVSCDELSKEFFTPERMPSEFKKR
eukprot:gene25636-11294_t